MREARGMVETTRLKLVPTTVALARAEIRDRSEFARLLGASVPSNWPPDDLADALPMFLGWVEAAPDRAGWFGWYALAAGDGSVPLVLVASGGFKGPPQDGAPEIGYSVLPQFRGRGYATEMVIGLVRWALKQPGILRVVAQTARANAASVRVLTKAGFVPGTPGTDTDDVRFEVVGGERAAEQRAAPDAPR
jgi:[ribosomal protein S5]-alanine N-acetyltransferase